MQHIDKRLTGWLDGSLDRAARDEVVAHCLACEDCRRLLAQSQDVWNLLAELPAPAPERSAWEGVARALAPSGGPAGAPVWWRVSFPAVAAAALVCGIVLGGRLAGEPTGMARMLTDEIIAGTLLSAEAESGLDGLLATALTDPAREGTR